MDDALQTMEPTSLASRLVELARRQGASDADAIAISSEGESIRVRQGKVESVEREDSRGIGLRAFVDQGDGPAFASASTSDLSDEGLQRLVDQVMQMARISAPDPDAVPPSGANHPETLPEQAPATPWNREEGERAALACEQAALAYSSDISNSEGAEAGFGSSHIAYASSDGFRGSYRKHSASLGLSVIAGTKEMQRDYEFDRAESVAGLRSAEELGRRAAERACRRMHAGSITARKCPVVFEPRVATSLAHHLTSAINGRAVLQQRSFLADAKGELIFPEWVQIVDDPAHPEGLGNRPFDGEGTRTTRRQIIENGRLTGFLTDRYAAKRLGTEATGHARRGLTGDIGIGTSNLIWEAGSIDVEQLLKDIGDGVFVTEMMGFGVNGVTGDYSRGAAGFLIENGELIRPVHEITVAGNLNDMFRNVIAAANDLTWFGTTAAPTIAIADMTIAGTP